MSKKKTIKWLLWCAGFSLILILILIYIILVTIKPLNLICNEMQQRNIRDVLEIEKEINNLMRPFINTVDKQGIKIEQDSLLGLFDTSEIYIWPDFHCQHAGITKYNQVKGTTDVLSTKYCPQCSKDEYSANELSIYQKKINTSEVKLLLANRNHALDRMDYWEEWEDLADDFEGYLSAPIDWLEVDTP